MKYAILDNPLDEGDLRAYASGCGLVFWQSCTAFFLNLVSHSLRQWKILQVKPDAERYRDGRGGSI